MNETSFLVKDQNMTEASYNSTGGRNTRGNTFNMFDSASQEVSMQMSEVDELLAMLGRAQTLLKEQASDTVQ